MDSNEVYLIEIDKFGVYRSENFLRIPNHTHNRGQHLILISKNRQKTDINIPKAKP